MPPRDRGPFPGEEDLLDDRGRSLPMRLLALLGAVSVLMLGVSSMAPLLHRPGPPELPDQQRTPVA